MSDYAFDPDFAEALAVMPTVSDFSTLDAIVAVRDARALMAAPVPQRDDVTREDRSIPGPAGAPDVTVRIYRSANCAPVAPAVLEIHGGGFMLGSLEMMDAFCDHVAATIGAVVVSVDYRLAPEHPYPAATQDCYAALCWLHDNAASLGVDAERIAIAGQSAGGGLAAGTVLMARDHGGPTPCFQLLEIPELDDRLETPSMTRFTDTPMWNRPNAIASWTHFLGDLHGRDVPIYAAPARAADLSGLPPTFVSVMEYDPLRDEGLDYAMRLLQAGVSTEVHAYPGTFHGSAMVVDAAVSKRAARDSLGALARALAG